LEKEKEKASERGRGEYNFISNQVLIQVSEYCESYGGYSIESEHINRNKLSPSSQEGRNLDFTLFE